MTRRRGLLATYAAIMVTAAALSGCAAPGGAVGDPRPSTPTTDPPATSTAPTATPRSAAVTTTTRTLPSGRSYLLHDADPLTLDRPLVLVLHPALHTPTWMEDTSGFSDLADERGVVVAYPLGEGFTWNAGGCCGNGTADDVEYLHQVVDDVMSSTAIDRTRTFIVGMSNGGMMAYRVECEMPLLFAAVGVVAGTLLDQVDCSHTPISVYAIHGSEDLVVPPAGGIGYGGCYFPSQDSIRNRLGAGSVFQSQLWFGGHDYPTWATARLWAWFESQSQGEPLSGHPTPPSTC